MKKIVAIMCSLVIASSLAGCAKDMPSSDSLNESNQEVNQINTITEEDITSEESKDDLLKE